MISLRVPETTNFSHFDAKTRICSGGGTRQGFINRLLMCRNTKECAGMMYIQEMQKREAIFFNIKAVPVICGDTKNYLLTVFVSIIL